MRRDPRLKFITVGVAALVVVSVASAGPVAAAPNGVAGSRAGIVSVVISVSDLAPAACAGMDLTNVVTIDDLRGGKIQGTRDNDLIVGTDGDDRIDAKQGDDCLVGGGGADDLDGGPGWDICVTGDDPGDSTRRCEG